MTFCADRREDFMRSIGLCTAALVALSLQPVFAADVKAPPLQNRSIGYATSELHYAIYETPDGKTECPDGFTTYGPREMFKDRYPSGGTMADTQLKTEATIWFP